MRKSREGSQREEREMTFYGPAQHEDEDSSFNHYGEPQHEEDIVDTEQLAYEEAWSAEASDAWGSIATPANRDRSRPTNRDRSRISFANSGTD